MIPNEEDFLNAACKWQGEHRGISYELSWHGRSEYSPQGTWCWYILISDEQFYPDDWAKLRLERQDRQTGESWHRHWSYENFPHVDPHGEWTFGEVKTRLGRDGQEHEHVKVGCDYAHAFDRDRGYWQGREDVERDVKHSIELLVAMFPKRRERCSYSGKFDDAGQFYTARHGGRVHKSRMGEFSEEKWPTWLPAEVAPAALFAVD